MLLCNVSILVLTASAVGAIPLPRLPCPTSATVALDVDTDIVFRYILFIGIWVIVRCPRKPVLGQAAVFWIFPCLKVHFIICGRIIFT